MSTCNDATNQDLLSNGLDQIISKLVSGPKPDTEPGLTAWTWLMSSGGPEPSQVNEYIQGQLGSKSVSVDCYSLTNNAASWSSAMSDAFDSILPPPPENPVWKWLHTNYVPREDLPTVPDEVIGWTKANMPTKLAEVVVVRKGAPSRAGS
jgi:hypothetical protein